MTGVTLEFAMTLISKIFEAAEQAFIVAAEIEVLETTSDRALAAKGLERRDIPEHLYRTHYAGAR